jgi:hypothetical protein
MTNKGLSETQRAGTAGTYLVAAKLSLEGFVATVTSRNARAVDILAYYPVTGRAFGIQVKTSSEKSTWKTDWNVKGVRDIAAPDLFFVFVKLWADKPHEFYVVHSKDVEQRLKTARGGWEWFKACEHDRDRWLLLKQAEGM